MSTLFAIPMNEETRIALEDCFIDVPNMDARKFCFDNIKLACMDASKSLRNKVTPINQRQEDGAMKQVEFKLKDIDLEEYKLPSDPAWLPENMDAEDNKPIELKFGDNTMRSIQNFGKIVMVRHEQFNKAEEEHLERTEKKMIAENAPPDNIERWEKSQDAIRKERLGVIPECIEEALHMSIWPLIQQRVDQGVNAMFDKEFKEEYPDKPAEPKKPAQ